MKSVKTYPKFQCDFCKKKTIKHAMIKHERICYLNPNRECRQSVRFGYEFLPNGHDEDCLSCKISKQMIEAKKEGRVINFNTGF